MRGILLVLCVLAAVPAHAGIVVVMTDRPAELGAALEVALANRRVDIARLPSPGGDLRLDRAAAAQRAAVAAGADAAVWIDTDGSTDVCAVSSDGRQFRHAPIGEVSPRMFAAIATSLLDELLAPPEAARDISVDVRVNVGPGTAPVAAPSPRVATIAPAPPANVDSAQVIAAAHPSDARRARTLFEIGPMLSPVSAGAEATVLFPLAADWRIGAMGAYNKAIDMNAYVYGGAIELRHVGSGKRRHFDLGFLLGGATADHEAVTFAAVRIAWTWEGDLTSTSLGFTPMLLKTNSDGDPYLPGIYASLRWGFHL